MLKNMDSSEILDPLFDKDVSEIIFYDTCSISKHACYYEEGFPISEWFNSNQLIIVRK